MPVMANAGSTADFDHDADRVTLTLPENSGAGVLVAGFRHSRTDKVITKIKISGGDADYFSDAENKITFKGGPNNELNLDFESATPSSFNFDIEFTITNTSNNRVVKRTYEATVGVGNVNESLDIVYPENRLEYRFEIDEDTTHADLIQNGPIGTIHAIDPEGQHINYIIPEEARSLFRIQGGDGENGGRLGHLHLRDANAGLDYEELGGVYELTVHARGVGTPPQPIRIVITVNDVLEHEGSKTIQLLRDADDNINTAGTEIVKVKFGGESAEYTVKDVDGGVVSEGDSANFAVENGFLIVATDANPGGGVYKLRITSGSESRDFTVRINAIETDSLSDIIFENETIRFGPGTARELPADGAGDGDTLTLVATEPGESVSTGENEGSYTVSADGVLTYTPEPGFVGKDTFTATVTDGSGGVGEQEFAVFVKSTVSVSGAPFTIREDSPWMNPVGTVGVVDDSKHGRAYTLQATALSLEDSVSVTVDDDDATATVAAAATLAGRYGDLTVNHDGSWSYEVDQEKVESLHGREDEEGHLGKERIRFTYDLGDDPATPAVEEPETLNGILEITISGLTDYYLAEGERWLNHRNLEEDLSLHSGDEFVSSDYVYVHGGSGDDVLHGMTRHSWLYGGGGDDWFVPGSKANHLFGGIGNDVYTQPTSGYHNAARLGSSGNIDVDFSSTERWMYDKETGNWISGTGDAYEFVRAWIDTDMDGILEESDEFDYIHQDFASIYGGTADDRIIAPDDYFNIHGGGGNDWLKLNGGGQIYAGSGDDVLIGGTGRSLLDGNSGNDIVDGSAGNADIYYFQPFGRQPHFALHLDLTDDVKWKRDEEGNWIYGVGIDFTYVRAWIDIDNDGLPEDTDEFDYLLDIEWLNIRAASGDDVLTGGDGHDSLEGNSGADELNGGGGSDILYGSSGNDELNGGDGRDHLYGGSDNDELNGGDGNDGLRGDSGSDILDGGDGNDYGTFSYDSATANLTLDVTDTATLWKQNDDGDWISSNSGGDGFIYQRFQNGSETDYFTNIENFSLYGGSGNDVLTGGDGEDNLYGGAGNDVITSGDGNDWLEGNSGNDVLNGGDGHNLLDGGSDNDELNGGGGNDWLKGGSGNDVLDGGDGKNRGVFSYESAAVDLRLDAAAATRWKQNDDGDWISGVGDGFIYQHFDAGDEVDYFTNIQEFEIRSGSGNDVLIGGDGGDRLYGGVGNDRLNGGDGSDRLQGGFGNDVLNGGGGGGYDTGEFSYSSATASLVLDAADATRWKQNDDGDWISSNSEGDGFIYQQFRNGDEVDYFTGIETLRIISGSGNDELSGGGGSDLLYGGSGNDVLNGGGGWNELNGQGGDDFFVLNLESRRTKDIVTDFSSGTVSGYRGYNGSTAGGNDKIRVAISASDGNTVNLDALDLDQLKDIANIRWANDSSNPGFLHGRGNANIDDTFIYATRGTADVSDDRVLMVLLDFTGLTIEHFDVVAEMA